MYPISLSTSASSGIQGDARTGDSGNLTFGSFAVGSGSRADTSGGVSGVAWSTVALLVGAAVALAFLLRKVLR